MLFEYFASNCFTVNNLTQLWGVTPKFLNSYNLSMRHPWEITLYNPRAIP